MKIAVVGAGLFGSISAIKLSNAGHDVTIFDVKSMLLQCASGINQYRLHRGYHYPRSMDTAQQSIDGYNSFRREYGDCLDNGFVDHYYAISNRSIVSVSSYVDFMRAMGLEFFEAGVPSYIDSKSVAAVFRVNEQSINLNKLRNKLFNQISAGNIDIRLDTEFKPSMVDEYDITINATYSNGNFIVPSDQRIEYQFELCEKPVVSLGEEFRRKSIVIIDGPFGCIDPYLHAGDHVMGHVDHAIHHRSIGYFPEIPNQFDGYLDSTVLYRRSITNINSFVDALEEYFPTLRDRFQHIGSMYTIRTVLPNREHDDARPSYITKHSDRLYSIFSGKLGTAVDIAADLVKIISI